LISDSMDMWIMEVAEKVQDATGRGVVGGYPRIEGEGLNTITLK
jgi:hypothetical protein